MTTTTAQPQPERRSPGGNNNHTKHNRRDRRENDRKHPHPARRSAAELIAHPPHGYTVQVMELDNDKEARKRLRLLVLASDNGFRLLPIMSIRTPKQTQTSDAGRITVIDDLDILPANFVESALEVNLISDDVLLRLAEIVADFRERQKHVVPSHKKPLVQRPFEELSVELQEKVEEDDMAKKIAAAKTAAKAPTKAPARPAQPATPTRSRSGRGDAAWWWASIC